MSGTSSSTQNTQQQSQTNPWAPAMPMVNGFISGIGNLHPEANDATQAAFGNIAANAGKTPDYSQQALNYAGNLINGGTDQSPLVQSGYDALKNTSSPYLNANYTDPTTSPGMANVLSTIRNDVGNSVNGMFAGAGRDMSGMNQQALARGIAQGEAQPLLNQYNQNVATQLGAAGNLNAASNSTASLLNNLQQSRFATQGQGFANLTTGLPSAMNAGATNTIAANQLPFQYGAGNMGTMESLGLPIAGLGGQSSGTSNTQGTQTMSPFQMAMMGIQTAGNLFSGGGNSALNGMGTAASKIGSFMPAFLG